MATNQAAPLPGNCPRTFAIWRPGQPQPGVNHSFSWSGRMPCTGVYRCHLCGLVADKTAPEKEA